MHKAPQRKSSKADQRPSADSGEIQHTLYWGGASEHLLSVVNDFAVFESELRTRLKLSCGRSFVSIRNNFHIHFGRGREPGSIRRNPKTRDSALLALLGMRLHHDPGARAAWRPACSSPRIRSAYQPKRDFHYETHSRLLTGMFRCSAPLLQAQRPTRVFITSARPARGRSSG